MCAKKLTPAQREALALLAEHDGKALDSWKQKTKAHGRPLVNTNAALSLNAMRLARIELRSFESSSSYRFVVTDAGRARAREEGLRP